MSQTSGQKSRRVGTRNFFLKPYFEFQILKQRNFLKWNRLRTMEIDLAGRVRSLEAEVVELKKRNTFCENEYFILDHKFDGINELLFQFQAKFSNLENELLAFKLKLKEREERENEMAATTSALVDKPPIKRKRGKQQSSSITPSASASGKH